MLGGAPHQYPGWGKARGAPVAPELGKAVADVVYPPSAFCFSRHLHRAVPIPIDLGTCAGRFEKSCSDGADGGAAQGSGSTRIARTRSFRTGGRGACRTYHQSVRPRRARPCATPSATRGSSLMGRALPPATPLDPRPIRPRDCLARGRTRGVRSGGGGFTFWSFWRRRARAMFAD